MKAKKYCVTLLNKLFISSAQLLVCQSINIVFIAMKLLGRYCYSTEKNESQEQLITPSFCLGSKDCGKRLFLPRLVCFYVLKLFFKKLKKKFIFCFKLIFF